MSIEVNVRKKNQDAKDSQLQIPAPSKSGDFSIPLNFLDAFLLFCYTDLVYPKNYFS